MELGASLVAGAEPFELVQPGEGSLDHPAHLAQSGTVGDAASRDQRLDAPLPQQATVLVEVVALVGIQVPGLAAGTPPQTRIDGTADSPFESPDVRPIHGAVVQVQQTGAAKLGQRGSVQARPHAGLGPVPQPAPGRHPGAAHHLRGNITPCDTGPQHVHDAGEFHSVGKAQPPGVAMAPFGSRRQQRGHPLPQVVRNKISAHSGHPADQDRRVQDPRLNSF